MNCTGTITKLWQKSNPVTLMAGKAAQAYGKGPFVHGYHAPAPPAGFSVGSSMGYWHADKKAWLNWEPEPLETHDDPPLSEWKLSPVVQGPKKKSAKEKVGGSLAGYHSMSGEGFQATILKYAPNFVHDTYLPVKNISVQSDFAGNATKMVIKYENGSTHEVTLSTQELEEQS
jgi:hypothetical protein